MDLLELFRAIDDSLKDPQSDDLCSLGFAMIDRSFPAERYGGFGGSDSEMKCKLLSDSGPS